MLTIVQVATAASVVQQIDATLEAVAAVVAVAVAVVATVTVALAVVVTVAVALTAGVTVAVVLTAISIPIMMMRKMISKIFLTAWKTLRLQTSIKFKCLKIFTYL